MVQQVAEAIFGSNTRGLVLQEVAKATQPVSAYAVAKISGLDTKNVYEECNRLQKLGIFRGVPIGRNQIGYLYSDNNESVKLKEFVYCLRKRAESIAEKIAAVLCITDYYLSLPVSLRITFDVFYAPAYIMVFVDRRARAALSELRHLSEISKQRIIVNVASLRAREFKYDKVLQACLASDEQAIADGLNYYGSVCDKEIIRTLLTRLSDFDLGSVVEKLNDKGVTRLLALLLVKKTVSGEAENDFLNYLLSRRRSYLDRRFRSDLESEAIPLLLPNDEAYKGDVFTRMINVVSRALSSLA